MMVNNNQREVSSLQLAAYDNSAKLESQKLQDSYFLLNIIQYSIVVVIYSTVLF